ncbi:MAG TPA: sialate O-acetylesterase [Segetibacter sp.]|nr:sialate O-acetylesterase [Segetibacter sp.]
MKNKKQVYILVLLSLVICNVCLAKIKLPAIVSSNMVLQRNTTITIWGWSDAKEKIVISASWLKVPVNVVADKAGAWKAQIQTSGNKEPQTIRLKSAGSNILLENILFGEVWLCSGQSNMTMPVKGYFGQRVTGAQQAIATAGNNKLRLFTVQQQASTEPQKELGKYTGWQSAGPESVKEFSAIAYFFGKQLQEFLDVPVGLIHTSWGGSLIEAWMSNESLSPIQTIDLSKVDLARGNRFQTVLFNAMINPLIPYTIKGALWYQGEGNASKPEQYKTLFPAMVNDWRQRWGIGNFPFYFVQIAPYMYDSTNKIGARSNAALMREAQLQCVDLIPNSGIAVTMDIGNDYAIHPPQKKEVADRLLYNALNQTYGYKAVEFAGPVYDSMEVKDGGIYVTFRHAEDGLSAPEGLNGFVVAGTDHIFYPANAAIIRGRQVFIKSDKVKNPVAARYAWRSWIVGTLFDTYMLPASSFRTDRWNDATEAQQSN